jgi:phosphoglycerol transferase MdoB-like AlkP superfamily enzyme
MSKGTSFGKAYAAAIIGNPLRNPKSRGIKAEAFRAYKEALQKYKDEEKPLRMKKHLEQQEELLKTKNERVLARKGKKAEKRRIKNSQKAEKEREAQLIAEQSKNGVG